MNIICLEDELWVDLVGLCGGIVNFEVMLGFAFSTALGPFMYYV